MARQGSGRGSGGGPSGGDAEKQMEWWLTHVGVPAVVIFFAFAVVASLFGKTPTQAWEAIKHPQAAAAGAWRAVQGTRCAVGTCPKNQWIKSLDALTVAPEANASTYRRAKFGEDWVDTDHNGCDTRDDILRRDLDHAALRKTKRCAVGAPVAGTLADPYSGATVAFTVAHPTEVEIDHVVSLGEAWRSGASAWTPAQRVAYANDPGVLVATTGKINGAKSDYDASKPWRECIAHGPTGSRCTGWKDDRPTGDRACDHAIRVVTIKTEYHLSVDPSERDALRAYLEGCVS